MQHKMKIRAIYFDKIKNGEKIYEVRLNDEKRQLIDVGDIIVFEKEPELAETFSAKVKDLVYFSSFNEMVNTLPLHKVGFPTETKEEVENIYYQFYSKENEAKYGVVAIKVQVINN